MEFPHVMPAGQAGFRDHLDTKAAAWFQKYVQGTNWDVTLMGAPLSKTSISHSGAFTFPQSVRAAFSSYGTYHLDEDIDVNERLCAADLGDIQMHPTDLTRCHDQIYDALSSYWRVESKPVLFLVGGDHSITAPAMRAFQDGTGEKVGVIHFDAHHDMRNLEDGGPTNGTPFRTLLEGGHLEGQALVQIGLRNFANARPYTHFARAHGVHLVTAESTRQRGMSEVLQEAVQIAGAGGRPIYVSFDMDVIDQAFAPGVPAPGPGGLTVWEVLDAVLRLGSIPQVRTMDFVCADPTVDVRNLTSRLAANLILQAAVGVAKRPGARE